MKGCFSDTYPFKSSLHLKKRQAAIDPATLKFAWELLQWDQGWIKWFLYRHIAKNIFIMGYGYILIFWIGQYVPPKGSGSAVSGLRGYCLGLSALRAQPLLLSFLSLVPMPWGSDPLKWLAQCFLLTAAFEIYREDCMVHKEGGSVPIQPRCYTKFLESLPWAVPPGLWGVRPRFSFEHCQRTESCHDGFSCSFFRKDGTCYNDDTEVPWQ